MGAYYSRAESYSRSYNAMEAEAVGRFPLTRAIEVVRKATGVTAKVAREMLKSVHDGEWHHVGKYANRVDYYDTEAALDVFQPQRVIEREVRAALSEALSEELSAEREIEIAWEIHGKTLAALATGLRAWSIPTRSRLIIFAAADETHASKIAAKWSDYGRVHQVVEVFAA